MAFKSKTFENISSNGAAAKSITPSNIILGSSHRSKVTADRIIITRRTPEGQLFGYIQEIRNWKQEIGKHNYKPADPLIESEINFNTLEIENWECWEIVRKSERPHEMPRAKCGSTFKYKSWLVTHIKGMHGAQVPRGGKNNKAPPTTYKLKNI